MEEATKNVQKACYLLLMRNNGNHEIFDSNACGNLWIAGKYWDLRFPYIGGPQYVNSMPDINWATFNVFPDWLAYFISNLM